MMRHLDVFTFTLALLAAIALTTCTASPAHGKIAAPLNARGDRAAQTVQGYHTPVLENTISTAVAAPTEKRGFVMSESQAGAGTSSSSRHGYGQDEPTRKGGCTAVDVFSTSCPPYALENAAGGFLNVPTGA